jgi:hypothetical protein
VNDPAPMTERTMTVWTCECGYRSLTGGRCRSHPYPARAMGPEMTPVQVVPVADARRQVLAELEQADDLLRRLSEWDMLYVSPEGKAVTSDGPFWQAQIKEAREALAAHLAEKDGTDPSDQPSRKEKP